MKFLKEAKINKGTKVLLRADFNVPIIKNRVVDVFRIVKTLPTILFLKKKGAKIIIISHAGDDGSQTLLPIAKILQRYLKVKFIKNIIGESVLLEIERMKNGEVLLLENLRVDSGEKNNDRLFSKILSSYGDIYINDAFPVSHRAHASIVGIPKFLPSYAGLQLEKEARELSKVLKPKHPFSFILGGNKFSTKMPLIKRYANVADHFFIGGALLNDLLKSAGFNVGESLVEEGYEVKNVLKNKKLIMPIDVVVSNNKKKKTVLISEVKDRDKIYDIGPKTVSEIIKQLKDSKLVLWNGPVGRYTAGFGKGTKDLLIALSKHKGDVFLGGGDTVALVSKLKLENKFKFVSTGGGATLEFLADGTLSGIKALEKSKKEKIKTAL
jgi:phosphoglycerate kinase